MMKELKLYYRYLVPKLMIRDKFEDGNYFLVFHNTDI